MNPPRHDYRALRDQYVAGNMSLRELCRTNGIKNHSPIVDRAKREGWDEARATFRAKTVAKTDDRLADRQADRRARAMEVMDHAFDAVDAVLVRMVEDLGRTQYVERHDAEGNKIWVEAPVISVSPGTAAALIDRLNVLVGNPSSITEERVSGDIALSGLPADVLRAIADTAGGRAAPRSVGRSPLPLVEGPRKPN